MRVLAIRRCDDLFYERVDDRVLDADDIAAAFDAGALRAPEVVLLVPG